MNIIAITNSEEEARQLNKLTGMNEGITSNGRTQSYIDMVGGMSRGIEWWKEDQPPTANPKWNKPLYYQGDMSLPVFFAHIQEQEKQRKVLHVANFDKFKGLFPNLEWEIFEDETCIWVRVKIVYHGGFGAKPISLLDSSFEVMSQRLAVLSSEKETKEKLQFEYPYLSFNPNGSSSNEQSPAMTAIIGNGDSGKWSVFLASYDNIAGPSAGYRFEFPMTDKISEKLSALNIESKKHRQKGWFFCTVCQVAKSRDEYGYYYFSETRCKDCLEPAWEARARAETYN